ncbi:unnamed protein product [Cladocopium goreaui]|uniref:Uncharacterized protein n=1 Tax=Cladocopium goreaui TaxID=2562237 RepID=A0A9P1FIG3_9DINO|nr:unnamed protein product [Cladocopium goreaui]
MQAPHEFWAARQWQKSFDAVGCNGPGQVHKALQHLMGAGEWLKSMCEDDGFIAARRKVLRLRAGLSDKDYKVPKFRFIILEGPRAVISERVVSDHNYELNLSYLASFANNLPRRKELEDTGQPVGANRPGHERTETLKAVIRQKLEEKMPGENPDEAETLPMPDTVSPPSASPQQVSPFIESQWRLGRGNSTSNLGDWDWLETAEANTAPETDMTDEDEHDETPEEECLTEDDMVEPLELETLYQDNETLQILSDDECVMSPSKPRPPMESKDDAMEPKLENNKQNDGQEQNRYKEQNEQTEQKSKTDSVPKSLNGKSVDSLEKLQPEKVVDFKPNKNDENKADPPQEETKPSVDACAQQELEEARVAEEVEDEVKSDEGDRKSLGELPEKKEKLWKEVDESLEVLEKDEEHHEKEFLKAQLALRQMQKEADGEYEDPDRQYLEDDEEPRKKGSTADIAGEVEPAVAVEDADNNTGDKTETEPQEEKEPDQQEPDRKGVSAGSDEKPVAPADVENNEGNDKQDEKAKAKHALEIKQAQARCENLVMLKAAVDDPDLRFPPVGLLDQKSWTMVPPEDVKSECRIQVLLETQLHLVDFIAQNAESYDQYRVWILDLDMVDAFAGAAALHGFLKILTQVLRIRITVRWIILGLIAAARGVYFVTEQPRSSLMPLIAYFRQGGPGMKGSAEYPRRFARQMLLEQWKCHTT